MVNSNVVAARIYIASAESPPLDVADDWFAAPPSIDISDSDLQQLIIGIQAIIDTIEQYDSAEQIQSVMYEIAKQSFGDNGSRIRLFFSYLYAVVFGRTNGPRWGEYIALFGTDRFVQQLRNNCTSIINSY